MPPQVKVEPISFPSDHRGLVFEPMTPETIPLQKNVHVALTGPGHIRGNFSHRQGTKTSIILGPALFRYREGGEVRDVHVPEGQAYRFTIPAGVAHAFKNTGTGPMLIIAFSTVPHDPNDPGVDREVLIEP